MTRPGIVRADTLDLQNQTSPSAQDHSHKPNPTTRTTATAPHQAAELRHVEKERHNEEEILSSAWQSATGLSEEPPSDDEIMNMSDAQQGQQRYAQQKQGAAPVEGVDGGEMVDDDMDKISSSPSITDGGYTPFTAAAHATNQDSQCCWSERRSSLELSTPTRHGSTHQRSPADTCDSDESSPFVATPLHFPMSKIAPRPASPFPFRIGSGRPRRRSCTPLDEVDSERSSSPFVETPAHLPLHRDLNSSQVEYESRHHHRSVGAPKLVGTDFCPDEECDRQTGTQEKLATAKIPTIQVQAASPRAERQRSQFYQQPRLAKSTSDIEFEAHLLPNADPLLEDVFVVAREAGAEEEKMIEGEWDDEAWETESETRYSEDSFESATFDNDDDKTLDFQLPADARFIDSGWGGECLRETEDIDFEFVYALHTFVATVEGQANAQKGDTMVLLDDSNSYWWLVRVVKDSTIGYLPAEHIETPTERLARLNKHRNVDLSQTMLGDTAEKSKGSIIKAMRRRNPKKVNFAQPTYIEPSEYEYTTDEESGDEGSLTDISPATISEIAKEPTIAPNVEESATAESVLVQNKKRDLSPEKNSEPDDDGRRRKIDEERVSDEQLDHNPEKLSRNGTVRNTDSFFRDETIETRKITLTPNLLRDESSQIGAPRGSLERGAILDLALLKEDPKPGKSYKKEKKPGMLSGLFKRKDKKSKVEEVKHKTSVETTRDSSSEEVTLVDRPSISDSTTSRTSSKARLQKSPQSRSPQSISPAPSTSQTLLSGDAGLEDASSQSLPRSASPTKPIEKQSSLRARASESVSGISNKLHLSSGAPEESKPLKVKRAKTREALDVESSPENEHSDPFADAAEIKQPADVTNSDSQGSSKPGDMSLTEHLLEPSGPDVKTDAIPPESEPPALVVDSSSNSSADELTSLRSSPSPPSAKPDIQHAITHSAIISGAPPPPTRSPPAQPVSESSPTIVQSAVSSRRKSSTSTMSSRHTPSTSTSSPAWSDAHLRAYMDSTDDIKDLLVVVHDTSGVAPVGPDHPLMSNLFVEERGKVKELDSSLDKMLSQWLAKKRGVGGKTNANVIKGGSRSTQVSAAPS